MTEPEWLAATDPTPMLEFMRGKVSTRKLRLFAIACCRRIDMLLVSGESQSAVAICEEAADRRVPERELQEAYSASHGPVSEFGARQDRTLRSAALAAERCVATTIRAGMPFDNVLAVIEYAAEAEQLAHRVGGFIGLVHDGMDPTELQVRVVRCLHGNPFRPVSVDPDWLTSTVLALAEAIYTDRAFERMPVLADALEDAGCDNADILNHCRGDGPHVRGCWVVDLLLGKG